MNSYITFIVKKVLLSIVTVFAISIFAFLIMQMTPGDPVRAMLGAEADCRGNTDGTQFRQASCCTIHTLAETCTPR